MSVAVGFGGSGSHKNNSNDGDMCPICKSSRYLNPDMKFLVNPECYHKMCESCVDRIYSLGPAPCPYPGCGKTLRKNKFKTQVFEDVGVEREVDVRSRVQKAFNKQQQDFESLDEYNDYLEQIEDMVFNLSNNIDVEETEARLQAYEQANRSAILANSLRNQEENEAFEENQVYEAEKRRYQAELNRKMEEEERIIKKEGEQEFLRRLAQSDGVDAEAIEGKVAQMVKKRIEDKRIQLESAMPPPSLPRKRRYPTGPVKDDAPTTPFTPFAGDRQTHYLFTVQDDYDDPWMADIGNDVQFKAGGVVLQDAYKQILVQAFFGLGCDIQQELAAPPEDQPMIDVAPADLIVK